MYKHYSRSEIFLAKNDHVRLADGADGAVDGRLKRTAKENVYCMVFAWCFSENTVVNSYSTFPRKIKKMKEFRLFRRYGRWYFAGQCFDDWGDKPSMNYVYKRYRYGIGMSVCRSRAYMEWTTVLSGKTVKTLMSPNTNGCYTGAIFRVSIHTNTYTYTLSYIRV